jgi:quinol monooxygenase YgiN
MILVTGDITARPDAAAEAIALSLTHVHRSRAEPGCLSHDVAIDADLSGRSSSFLKKRTKKLLESP